MTPNPIRARMTDPKSLPRDAFRPGQSVPRLEDRRFLTGSGCYMADMNADGQAHAAIVRADHAHAKILAIDTEDAAAMPGVIGIHTITELDADGIGAMRCSSLGPHLSFFHEPPHPALARGRVRHVGEPVALVVAETALQARDAAEAVMIDYDALDAAVDPVAALAPGAAQIWDDAPGNLAYSFETGDAAEIEAVFADAPHVVELSLVNNRVTAAPLEPRAGIGDYDAATETYILTCNAQGVHGIRGELANDLFHVAPDRVRVSAPDVGGGFGLKNFMYSEWVLLPWAAKRHGRPVKWVAGRGEDFAGAVHGRASRVTGRLALDESGRFLALAAEVIGDMGAYLSGYGPGIAAMAMPTAIGSVYDIPQIHLSARGAFTNTVPCDAYRGAGKPEANFITERLIETAARRLGFDPVDLRRMNAIQRFPHVNARGMTIDSGRIADNIDAAEQLADRDGFESRRRQSAERGRLRGLGFGCFLETARGAMQEGTEVRLTATGAEIRVGTESQGQGHETAFTQITAERLGLDPAQITYVQADTAKTRMGHGHGGARSMHMGGGTLSLALDAAIEQARAKAAQLLQADAEALRFQDGQFTRPDGGPSVSLLDVAASEPDGLVAFEKVENAPLTFPQGCHAAEVEVDPASGEIQLLNYVACDDYGRIVNPRLTEGQVIGGIVQGIGQALGEEALYDAETGQLISGSFMDYFLPRAGHLPPFTIRLDGVPTDANALGVKGSGQAGCMSAPQTLVNAVIDALSPLGVEHIDMPLTREKVWRAIAVARQARRA